jgi:hypothetical protein
MSALAAIQEEWPENSASKYKIGVLLWDLSAGVDTSDPNLLCAMGSMNMQIRGSIHF